MAKVTFPVSWKCLWPMPAPTILVSSVDRTGVANLITLGAAGVACARPPLLSIAVAPARYSHTLIRNAGDFVVNVPGADLSEIVDKCGSVSGRDCDKFARFGLTALPATVVRAPLVRECPVNIECKLHSIVPCGSHDLFLGEVVCTHADEDIVAPARDSIDPERFDALISLQTTYFRMGRRLAPWFVSRESGNRER